MTKTALRGLDNAPKIVYNERCMIYSHIWCFFIADRSRISLRELRQTENKPEIHTNQKNQISNLI